MFKKKLVNKEKIFAQKFKQNKGLQVNFPKIGFGTWEIEKNISSVVYDAIECGYRLVDTAKVYESEVEVGNAIRQAIQDRIVKREDLIVQTKLAPDLQKGGGRKIFDNFCKQLSDLKLDYIDVYMMHWPVNRGSESTYREENIRVWEIFCELKAKGYIRHVGVSNFLERHILQLLNSVGVIPEINQLELHPGYQQIGLVEFCREMGIVVEAWSPLGRGILNQQKFIDIANRYSKSTNQLALRWSVQKGFIPICRSSKHDHILENKNIFDFVISCKDMSTIDLLNSNLGFMDIWSYKRQQMY